MDGGKHPINRCKRARAMQATHARICPGRASPHDLLRREGTPQRRRGSMTDSIARAPFYHDGMRELQDRFDGRRVADGLQKHRLHFEFWEQDRKLIREARFFFIATSYRDNVDCSMRSGVPAFVKITGPDTLECPEYDG